MAFSVGYDAGDVRSIGRLVSVYRAYSTVAQNAALSGADVPPAQLGDVWLISCGLTITTVATFHANVTAESSGVNFMLADPAGAFSLFLGTMKWRNFQGSAIGTEPLMLEQPVLWRSQWQLGCLTPSIDANAVPTNVPTVWAVVRPTRRTS